MTAEQDFGSLVRWALYSQSKSQRWLVEKMNEHGLRVDASSVSRLLSGERSTRLSEAVIIARALGIDLNALLDQAPGHVSATPILIAELRALVERWEELA